MRRLMMVCLIVCFSMAFVNVMDVQACSGMPYDFWPLDDVLRNSLEYPDSLVVVGRINSVSDSRVNAILQIDQILKGDLSNEFILYTRDSTTNLQFLEEGRGYPYHCGYTGAPLSSGRRFVAVLQHGDRGNYGGRIITEEANGLFSIPDPDQPEHPNQADQMISLDYEEIIAYTLQRINGNPHYPQQRVMPRAGYVHLLTESGDMYFVPTDSDQPMLVQPSNRVTKCYQTCLDEVKAPNGIDTAYFYPVGTVNAESNDVYEPFTPKVDGETGVFSDLSDLLAVWVGQELRIYTTAQQAGMGTAMSSWLTLVNTLSFNSDDALRAGAGAWSPNGRTFAFSSQSGVWLWDALSPDSKPILLLPAKTEPIAVRFFSPMGNYLAVESAISRYNIDVATHQEYPDGVFSTDDRLLAVYDTTVNTRTPLKVYVMLPEFKPEDRWQNFDIEITRFEWIDRKEYLYATCGDPIIQAEMPPGFDKPWCKIRRDRVGWDSPEWVDGTLFDHDPVTDSLATVIDQDTITFNGEVIELEEEIDSPIIGIELIPLIDLNHRNF